MIDEHEVREMLRRRAETVPAAPTDTPATVRRAHRRLALNGAVTAVAAVAIAVAAFSGVDLIRTAPVPMDTPPPTVVRDNGEVLRFTGVNEPTVPDGSLSTPGDLVAVDPRTGEERVLLEDLDNVHAARWSADGRWLAYEADAADGVGRELWVAGASQPPVVVATGTDPDLIAGGTWKWSPAGAELATIGADLRLRIVDVAAGETIDLGAVVADLFPPRQALPTPWAWSPDGTRLVVGSPSDGSLYSVDARSAERSLLARLPEGRFVEEVRWSPDGAHIAFQVRTDPGGLLYVMEADGSNGRLVADDSNSLGFAWSPDGTRLAFGSEEARRIRIRVTTIDGAAGAEVGTAGIAGLNGCARSSWGGNFECSVTWSPDGTRVAFRIGETGKVTVFDAAGSGEAAPLDELTFLGWDGGWYEEPVWGVS